MSHRYFMSLNSSERQSQRFSPQHTPSKSVNFGNTAEDNFVDFVPLDNSSPVQIGGRGGYRRSHNNAGHYTGFSPYNSNRTAKFASHNRSHNFNRSQKYSPQNNRGGLHNSNRSSNCDLGSWYDASMMEDPWAELENKPAPGIISDASYISTCNDPPSKDEVPCANKNSASVSSSYHTAHDKSWTQTSHNLRSDLTDSPKSFELTGINELSPSLSEKSVENCSPKFGAILAHT